MVVGSPDDEQQQGVPVLGEDSYRMLVDSIRDYAIIMLNPQGRVISWNAGAERIKGYTAAEIIGRHFKVFYLPEDRESGQPEQELRTARETGRYEAEHWRMRKNGRPFRAHVVVTALRNAAGELQGYAKITQDITERSKAEQELRESEERSRIMIEQVRDYAIFMLSPQGRIATWNHGAWRIKGYEASEVIGRHVNMFYPPEEVARGKVGRLLHQAATEGVARDVGWRIRKDGSRFWADVTMTALHDVSGKLYGFAKVIRDLTERVEAEELAQAYEAAQEAVRVRDEFLSIASHELRTPLTAAHLQLQGIQLLLKSGALEHNPERISQSVKRALSSTERLSQLVDTLLDVSRITTSRIQLHLSEFDLADAARDAADRLAEMMAESGCELQVRASESIVGRWDRLRLEQALVNLISNACKYAPGSSVEVGVQRLGERVQLWVKDHGPGIPADKLERIFERFERASPVDHYGGLGLGLFVTQQIAEAHGGSAKVRSREGEGSVFTLELPLETQPPTDVA